MKWFHKELGEKGELINKINASMEEMHKRCMGLIEEKHVKDKEIAELKEQLSILRCSHINIIEANAIEKAANEMNSADTKSCAENDYMYDALDCCEFLLEHAQKIRGKS